MAVLCIEGPPYVCFSVPPPEKNTHMWNSSPMKWLSARFLLLHKDGPKTQYPAVDACHISDAPGMPTSWCWISQPAPLPHGLGATMVSLGSGVSGWQDAPAQSLRLLGPRLPQQCELRLFVCTVKAIEPVTLTPSARCKRAQFAWTKNQQGRHHLHVHHLQPCGTP